MIEIAVINPKRIGRVALNIVPLLHLLQIGDNDGDRDRGGYSSICRIRNCGDFNDES